ncbi:protein FAR-RED IMPAIRED RESPONSE 1 isoform X1 [Triticum aestivum]|uniref:protein FAR-RED IMPAIRED RESPONSE 1 isoform X1 n=1 Tax=Triticum aestivum TaxID=4565 RepID=UPI001D0307B7|nr:protein FAR-RED IMPAIRED RESPONSE 1-like isoform X1 [Triticum aestivum]
MVPQIQELLKIRRLCQISPTSQILTTLKRPSLNRIPFQFRGLKGPDLAKFLTAVPHYREGKVLWKNSYKQERRQAWSRTQYHVLFHQGSGGYLCECGLYSHMGMLCCHAIRVLLHLGVREILEVHIMKRWTKNACENLPEHLMIYKACNSALKDATYRHSSLYSKALEIVQMGDKNTEAYGAAMKQLLDAISVLNDINQ